MSNERAKREYRIEAFNLSRRVKELEYVVSVLERKLEVQREAILEQKRRAERENQRYWNLKREMEKGG